MHNRIRQIRKALKMNQRTFGEYIGLTQTTLSVLEKGKGPIIEKNVKLICSTFHVNERWFRTGEGEMFCASPHESEFQTLFNKLMPDTQRCLLRIARELLSVQDKLLEKTEKSKSDSTAGTIPYVDLDT
jgi:transcriptional regulator with XRE-family HTH domain